MSLRWQRRGTGNHDSRTRIRHVRKEIGMSVVGKATGSIHELPLRAGGLFALVIWGLPEHTLITTGTHGVYWHKRRPNIANQNHRVIANVALNLRHFLEHVADRLGTIAEQDEHCDLLSEMCPTAAIVTVFSA